MAAYRVRHAIGVTTLTTSSHALTVGPSKTSLGYTNLGLLSWLNIDVDDEMNWPEASVEGQSIEEEFTTYDNSKQAPINQDLFAYWGVSGLLS
jgi:hypothetical protein